MSFRDEIYSNLNSQRNEKKTNELLSQETYNFQFLGNDGRILSYYNDVKICSFNLLVVKLWLIEHDGVHTSSLMYFRYIHSKVQTFHSVVRSLSDNFAANQPNTDFLTYL